MRPLLALLGAALGYELVRRNRPVPAPDDPCVVTDDASQLGRRVLINARVTDVLMDSEGGLLVFDNDYFVRMREFLVAHRSNPFC